MKIGSSSLLDELPQYVDVDGEEYILTLSEDNDPVLFSRECPHRGAKVQVEDDCLHCPWHGWEFDCETGNVTNVQGKESLTQFEVYQQKGDLYADIPEMGSTINFSVLDDNSKLPSIDLISHATLSIEHDGFRLVTDPWIDGPAMLDSWTQYPPPNCDIKKLASDTDAIWITHEHPDHLHPRTLNHFSNDTPIYVPELNAFRLSNRLYDLGFENVHSLPTRKPYDLAENVEVVCFESKSTFNDSVQIINCGGFKILNAHDAGVDWSVKEAVPSVDMVATEFSAGAGDYPVMWDHIDYEETKEFISEKNEQKIEEFEFFVDMFDPDYLLPFAKFMERPHPEQESRWELMEKNQPSDIVNNFQERDVRVLDLLPGESWNGKNDNIERRADRERFFREEFKQQYLQTAYESMDPVVDENFDLTHNELSRYFEDMGDSELATKIGDFALTLSLTGDGFQMNALIRIRNGEVEYQRTEEPIPLGSIDAKSHVSMSCPGEQVQFVIRNDRSWDDIKLGWWAECNRYPDEHNKWFWRMMHAPWEAREDIMRVAEGYDIETDLDGIPIAELIEKEGIEEILSNYGLYCVGCSQGIAEDIIEAARIHGFDTNKAQQLINHIEENISSEALT